MKGVKEIERGGGREVKVYQSVNIIRTKLIKEEEEEEEEQQQV